MKILCYFKIDRYQVDLDLSIIQDNIKKMNKLKIKIITLILF